MSNKMSGCHLANAGRSRSKHILQWRYRYEVSVQSINQSSIQSSPLGSFIARIPALMKALQRTSLRRLCRINRPGPILQERKWRPRPSTREPQGHWWGSQICNPNRRPTPMRTASSSRRNPQEVICKALSQSSACSDVTASIRARSEGSFAPASKTLRPSRTAALSQFLCLVADTSCGGMALNAWHHDSRASEMHGSSPNVS